MKRLFSFMMALVLVLSLSVGAFAAPKTDGSITITNATIGEEYQVYKIFDATYNSNSVTYTINSTNQFFDDLFGADGTIDNDYFTYHESTGVVTKKDGVNDGDLFKYLDGLIKNADATANATAEDTSLTFGGLTTGYYVIERTNSTTTGVTITTAKPHADVHDKSYLPGGDFDKATDKGTAAVGDTINWTLTFTATNYDYDKKVLFYTIKDTLSPSGWAAIDTGSIAIQVANQELTKDTDWKLENGNANGFEISIPWVNDDGSFKYASSAAVTVTYSATVLDAAAANNPATQQNKNTADLDWETTTGPNDGPNDETETKVYNLGFTKVDGTDSSKTLPGAIFEVYSNPECTTPVYVKQLTEEGEGVYMVDSDGTSNKVETPKSGQVVIMGLDKGTYYLKETTAPDGYNMLANAQEVKVGNDGTDGTDTMTINGKDYIVNNAEMNIENNSGVELPSTGGKGTMMMITFGTMVAIAFAVLLITHKKMSIYHD